MMRLAVLSDIHGNGVALDAVLQDLQRDRIEQVVCLGDTIQGGPQPVEVLARLRELGCPVVMGNTDAWLLTGEDSGQEVVTEERQRMLDAVREWTLAQLPEDDLQFMRSFQPTVEMTLEGDRKLLCFHGSPASFDDVILPDITRQALGAYPADALTGGHTHVQFLRRIDAGPRFFFNPGSVGFVYSHHQEEDDFRADPWAEYAVLSVDGGRLALEFRRVPFDAARLVEVYYASGRPYAEQAAAQYGG